ncbi:oxidoreductase, partial [Streptomyces sp. SID9124]|nr:oxidoreductase [Streptomyces sp. SID9124]
GPGGGRFLLRTGRRLTAPTLVVSQGGALLHRRRLARAVPPGSSFTLTARWLDRADPEGGAVRIRIA